jgi:hypothetical protein
MAERIRLDRDHPEPAPEEAVIESWVENLGVYLMIPSDDIIRGKTDIGRRRAHRRNAVNDSWRRRQRRGGIPRHR